MRCARAGLQVRYRYGPVALLRGEPERAALRVGSDGASVALSAESPRLLALGLLLTRTLLHLGVVDRVVAVGLRLDLASRIT